MEFTKDQQQRMEEIGWGCANQIEHVSCRLKADEISDLAELALLYIPIHNDPPRGSVRRYYTILGVPDAALWSLFIDLLAVPDDGVRLYENKSTRVDLRDFVGIHPHDAIDRLRAAVVAIDEQPWVLTLHGRQWLEWKEREAGGGAVERP